MQKKALMTTVIAAGTAVGFVSGQANADTITVITAGDENMVEYVTDYLGPMFESKHDGVEVVTIGTGPGDAGSMSIYERLSAQEAAGQDTWDVDVAVVHQKIGGDMVREGLFQSYRDDIGTGDLVTSPAAENALGQDVSGYVMPMFQSQTAIAYHPMLIDPDEVPESYEELIDWAAENPGQFGYNGIEGGMAGVAFVVGWLYAMTDGADQMMEGPYDPDLRDTWSEALANLADFNDTVTITSGNAGTLDQLNRGEIAMGPVWVDMFYTWQEDGRLHPESGLKLIAPGMPGQPMYYAIPARAANEDLARDFIELATSPEVQAEGIVERFNWYPGIDAEHVQPHLSEETWNRLFEDVPPETLSERGKTFPLAEYFDDVLDSYEREVR